MINKLTSSAHITKTQSKQKHSKTITKSKNNAATEIDLSLISSIIVDLQNNRQAVTKSTIQQRIVLLVLNDLLGEKASNENKFKAMYDRINETLNGSSQAQRLIMDTIKKYDLKS